MRKLVLFFLIILFFSASFSQAQQKIYTIDIDNFWAAHDSIQKVSSFPEKINIINKLYIDKGTKGLKAFMKVRKFNDTLWVKLLDRYPKFWNSIKPNTLKIKDKIAVIEKAIVHLHQLYPELKEAEMYFTIGGLSSGGTLKDNLVLIGTEIATGNPETDMSEFKSDWLKNVFKEQSLDHIVSLNIHEYIHTQQKGYKNTVLNQCINEGSCDFIAELAVQTPLQRKYLSYGRENGQSIKALFKKEMFGSNFSNWLYNGSQKGESADLGYYMGYEICKAYYNQAKDKKQAIKDIIELDYSNEQAVEAFLLASKFYTERIDKKQLLEAYSKNQPVIVKMLPFKNGSQEVDAALKEFRITFSKEMMPMAYGLNYAKQGKAYYPVKKVRGFENNNQTLVIEIELQPDKEYEFLLNQDEFRSKDGYPLKKTDYAVLKFKTKPL